MGWTIAKVPTGIHDSTKKTPIHEGPKDTVLEDYGKWKNGDNSTPIKDAKNVVVADEKGHAQYSFTRPETLTGAKAK